MQQTLLPLTPLLIVMLVSAIIGGLSMIHALFIAPAIFNWRLIPKIERKLGKELRYDPLYKYIAFSWWQLPALEISGYIVGRYIALKIWGKGGLPSWYFTRYALYDAGYTIDMASRTEIFMSFTVLLAYFLFFFTGFIAMIGKYLGVY